MRCVYQKKENVFGPGALWACGGEYRGPRLLSGEICPETYRARLPPAVLSTSGYGTSAPFRRGEAAEDRCHCPRPIENGRSEAERAHGMTASTNERKRRRAATERRRYVKKRLAHLRNVHPELPNDVLDRVALRQVSVSVRRAGAGQSSLAAFRLAESSSGLISKEISPEEL